MVKYSGFSFSFTLSSGGIFNKKTNEEIVKDSLRQIVSTGRGERVMRRSFGCGIIKTVFDNMNLFLADVQADFIIEAIRNFENRVTVNKVTVTMNESKALVDDLIEYTYNGNVDKVKFSTESV
jgi:phage baseplate assembly protein W